MAKIDDELPYRPCVGIMLLNDDGLVWIGRRIKKPHDKNKEGDFIWQMPQGGIDKGENPLEAAKRELYEETGIKQEAIEVIEETKTWLTYDLPQDLMGTALKGKYRGQQQKWFAMRFKGSEADVDLSEKPGEKAEFDAWRWEYGTELPNLIVPFKREVYRQLISIFGSHLKNK